MTDLSKISAAVGQREPSPTVVVSLDCAVELLNVGLLTEDRSETEQAALLALAGAVDALAPGDFWAVETIRSREPA